MKADGHICPDVADKALNMLDDAKGFDYMIESFYLRLWRSRVGGPVGIDNMAAAIGEEKDTIEDVLEPYLIQQGYLQRTPRGRIATDRAYLHFGIDKPSNR